MDKEEIRGKVKGFVIWIYGLSPHNYYGKELGTLHPRVEEAIDELTDELTGNKEK